ncbi:YciI family protein [Chitinimonas sp.]|uniref:YciI family protein n=1 Tax=Chitinimonas sp. TaxID=1934313 RepID=UPI002F9489E3
MYYAITGIDTPDSLAKRLESRPAHLARLHALQAEGRLLLAGPFPAIDSPDPGPAGFSGSLIVAEFDSLGAATEWAEADPYKLAGVYARVEVRPFKKVLPA